MAAQAAIFRSVHGKKIQNGYKKTIDNLNFSTNILTAIKKGSVKNFSFFTDPLLTFRTSPQGSSVHYVQRGIAPKSLYYNSFLFITVSVCMLKYSVN